MLALAACSSAESPPAPVGGSSSGRTTPPGAVNAATNVLDTPPGTSTSSGGLGAIEGGPPPATTTTTTRPPNAPVADTLRSDAVCSEGELTAFDADLDGDGLPDRIRSTVSFDGERHWSLGCVEVGGATVHWQTELWGDITELPIDGIPSGAPVAVVPLPDGESLVLVPYSQGASTVQVSLLHYRTDADGPRISRIGGLSLGGSVGHGDGVRCVDGELHALQFRLVPDETLDLHQPGWYVHRLMLEPALHYQRIEFRSEAEPPPQQEDYWMISGCQLTYSWPRF